MIDLNNSTLIQRNSNLFLASLNIQSYSRLDFGLSKQTLGLENTDDEYFYQQVETLNCSFNSTQLILDLQANIRHLYKLLKTINTIYKQDKLNQDQFKTLIKSHQVLQRDIQLYYNKIESWAREVE
ncbi:Hypothetical_protein [Hexamita inflata]|uniref:Hypothetical_protein n=1 Tax=Hexamita inflata TaxID=28002 RepID=A0AA86TU92_9EUKA|nr:Hypothetical protein HINF_LOCUS9753 [Hexamita inflata]